jgi:hypothetical protein
MLKTGAEYLESIRDGRRVYIGSGEVPDAPDPNGLVIVPPQ